VVLGHGAKYSCTFIPVGIIPSEAAIGRGRVEGSAVEIGGMTSELRIFRAQDDDPKSDTTIEVLY
jgi:hypothetical protein